ncbi:serine-type D-Ala-D-Ala carboxypeptidase [Vibrio sp. vnigr-6D03]|uniref:serine-type D-Ala-D-Ala carboxypeptidase n=1 Tax=Vibrio sp. vnigr-6D03 TaxID=2058088 RepID=UPI000C3245D2|nr:serine-type D-Ala-D-Ala carboxypeptidase [Vibrio sp. vnigr-6D03]PKF78557.1 serine-type D-Ala-D-Ala carboxypeptidase [Vibrio sp. vnigr-6D03]
MRTLIFLFFLISFQSLAYAPVDSLPYGSRHTLLVSNSFGDYVLKENSEQFFPPASTLKILTALAAKLELGNDFRFETHFEIVEQNLVIRFSGDPELRTEHLTALTQRLTQQGITSVNNVILDNSAFRGYERAVGWPWDILGVCYSAPASAITLDNNCVQASISSQSNQATSVFVPSHQPIDVTTDALSLNKVTVKSKRCQLELITSEGNQYHLSGCMQERDKPLPLKFAVQDTYLYVSAIIQRILAKNGISVTGSISSKNETKKGIIVATHQSQALPELLKIMLSKSDNLIADNLTKTMGARFYHQPGSFSNGTEAIKQILYTRAGINLEHTQLEDGSGLSRNNRLTSSDMEKVLKYVWKHNAELGLIELLPVSGQSGTLKYRKSMRTKPIAGRITAKSGSLYGSYNMAGYVLDEKNKPTSLFVQFVTDYHPIKKDDAPKVIAPIFNFEKQFYRDLVNSSLENDSLR